jgi:hypothetical protein
MYIKKHEKEIVLKLDRNVTKIKLKGKYASSGSSIKCDATSNAAQAIKPAQNLVTKDAMFEIY